MQTALRKKLLKYNFFSIVLVVVILALFFMIVTYKLIEEIIQTSDYLTKDFYIKTQKKIVKNQVNNFVSYIEHLREMKTKEIISHIDKLLNISVHNVKLSKNPKKALESFVKYNNLKIIYIENGKVIFKNINVNLAKINFNKKLQKIGDFYYLVRKINKNSFFIAVISQNFIDEKVKKEAIKYVYSIRFGAKNNGYISIAEILNYKGGKKFARVVALPVKPEWVGKYLNDNKLDAKGKPYRKEYLKIANSTGEGYVSYWFFKKKDKKMHPKISYIKLYKPFNWLVFSSVYLDDIDKIIAYRNEIFYQKVKKYLFVYGVGYVVILILIALLAKYENKIFNQIIENYETKIEEKNKKLEEINKNLTKLVEEKTQEVLKKYFTDNLTGLPNREKLLSDLNGHYVAILNIVSFKEINDFYGIKVGDMVLKKVSKEILKFSNNLYRLSADEYALLAEKPNKLVHLAKKLNAYFEDTPIIIYGEKLYISFRGGIGKNLQEADLALKYAKYSGKNIIVFNKRLPILKEFENNIKWRKIIYEAIKNDNVIPYVQAIVDNFTKEVVKYECLMRIKHDGEIFTPYYFLNIARKTNQYEMLQKILIEKCFKKFSTIKKEFSINLDSGELTNHQFQKWLLSKIDEYNVGTLLTVELLENFSVIENDEVKNFMKTLKERGVKIAIDDFGSGYSNFVYLLKDLPADILKIDGSIIKDVDKKEIYLLLEKIVEIANTFNFYTIGEFVENEQIYQRLKELGINASQGYYFSKPFNLEDL